MGHIWAHANLCSLSNAPQALHIINEHEHNHSLAHWHETVATHCYARKH